MNQWRIGDVKVTRIIESEARWDGTTLLPNATAENVRMESDWLLPAFSDEDGKIKLSIHSLPSIRRLAHWFLATTPTYFPR